MINVLLICGGGSSEHDISLLSAKFILNKLKLVEGITPHYMCIEANGDRIDIEGNKCELRKAGYLIKENAQEPIYLNYAIPCIHGYPGETGDIQSLFDMMGLPYLGAGAEASKVCFNKVTTKLWLSALEIPNTPYVFLNKVNKDSLNKVNTFFNTHGDIYVKASSQGSSLGCFHIETEIQIKKACEKALSLSPYVLVEKTIKGRELEVAVFNYKDELHAYGPGEIKCNGGFYSFEEKYNQESKTEVSYHANDISDEVRSKIKELAKTAFSSLGLKDMARVDFFLTDNGEILINEINTFPGHTDISLFPQLLETNKLPYEQYLKDRIYTNKRSK
jgi:D-alanine-D-alanine ligase